MGGNTGTITKINIGDKTYLLQNNTEASRCCFAYDVTNETEGENTPDIENQMVGQVVLDRFMKIIGDIEISELEGHKISISLGAVMIEGKETFEQMYTKADSLMYDCKEEGGNVYKFY